MQQGKGNTTSLQSARYLRTINLASTSKLPQIKDKVFMDIQQQIIHSPSPIVASPKLHLPAQLLFLKSTRFCGSFGLGALPQSLRSPSVQSLHLKGNPTVSCKERDQIGYSQEQLYQFLSSRKSTLFRILLEQSIRLIFSSIRGCSTQLGTFAIPFGFSSSDFAQEELKTVSPLVSSFRLFRSQFALPLVLPPELHLSTQHWYINCSSIPPWLELHHRIIFCAIVKIRFTIYLGTKVRVPFTTLLQKILFF
jgi:hypothetical protein